MGKYSCCKTWGQFFNQVIVNNNEPKVQLTNYIDGLLLEGDFVQDLHNKIKLKQKENGGWRYKKTGDFLDEKGHPKEGSFWGHIADLIINEQCLIVIDSTVINNNSNIEILNQKYKENKFIRIEGFQGTRRSDINKNQLSNNFYPDEIQNHEKYYEGVAVKVYINRFERNKSARKDCLKHYGYKCRVCEFDFNEKYGEIGHNFIHVHHTVPLSEINESYEVDPIKDLIPVCPNCHSMLHRNKEVLTITELKHIIAQQKNALDRAGARSD